ADFATVFVTWPAMRRVVREINVTATPTTLALEMNPSRISTPPRLLAQRMLSVLAIQQFVDKLLALEIQQLRVLFLAPVERHAHLPRGREDIRIFDRCFVRDNIRAGACVALHHVQLVAMEISGTVKPCLIVQV